MHVGGEGRGRCWFSEEESAFERGSRGGGCKRILNNYWYVYIREQIEYKFLQCIDGEVAD